ncbi:hypothetical protein B296_00005303 [Ensete ventricosum]|uniref:Uncharacterized protein n=1 Tax=Ensete ventricosum TaxID=4639 RepID=A0A427AVP0_ENSVE|nr:hypothetical protein B296_00005303 [Ensete ventricosum]
MELQPDDEPRLSLGIRPGSDDAVGSRREFARRFTEGIEKLAGNTPRDHWNKIGRLTARMPEAVGLTGWLNRTYLVFGQLTMGKPPRSTSKLLVPNFFG